MLAITFLLFGQFVEFPLCGLNRTVFYPFAEEYKGDDGCRCFIKDISCTKISNSTDHAVEEGSRGAEGYQYIHVGDAAAQAFNGTYTKIIHSHNIYRDADDELHPGIHQEWKMPWEHVRHQYQG